MKLSYDSSKSPSSKSPSSKSPSSKSPSSKSPSSKSSSSKSSSSKSPSSKSPSSKSSSSKSSSYSRRNIFEKFGDVSSHIVQKLIDDDISDTLLSHNAGKFKLNDKELHYILQQLIDKNTTTEIKYQNVIEDLLYVFSGNHDIKKFKRILYIFNFCMKNRKFSLDVESFLKVMNKELFNFFVNTIVDKTLTNQKEYDQIISYISDIIKKDYYNYEDEEEDFWILKILEYCAEHRKFNLKHFKQLSSSILHYYNKNEYDGDVQNDNMAVFVEKIIIRQHIDSNETKENTKKIHKILLNIYNEIFDNLLFAIYENDMKMELRYTGTKKLLLFMKQLFKNLNEIIINFDSDDFEDREIKNSLLLRVISIRADHDWRRSGEYHMRSPPKRFWKNIILGDGETLKILEKKKAYTNIEYVFDDFEIVN